VHASRLRSADDDLLPIHDPLMAYCDSKIIDPNLEFELDQSDARLMAEPLHTQ
jgi:hypothetical protein